MISFQGNTEHTREESEEVVHVLLVLVLLAPVPEGAEGRSRRVQPQQLAKEPPDRLPTHTPKLHNSAEGLLRNYGFRVADEVEELIQHLQTDSESLRQINWFWGEDLT